MVVGKLTKRKMSRLFSYLKDLQTSTRRRFGRSRENIFWSADLRIKYE